jgi:cell division protein FtsI/penicillin-binding protein 2
MIAEYRPVKKPSKPEKPRRFNLSRELVVLFGFVLLFTLLIGRLFYWQVIHAEALQEEAQDQYTRTLSLTGHRGKILTADGFTLVGNKKAYRLVAQPYLMDRPPLEVASLLNPLITDATDSAMVQQQKEALTTKLSDPSKKWLVLKPKVSEEQKAQIDLLKLKGITFENLEVRDYPEASMAAHVTGFVGKDKDGNDQGYFGIEGEYDQTLRGQTQKQEVQRDGLGFHLIFDHRQLPTTEDGQDLILSLRRDVQFTVEQLLKQGVEKYGALSGEVIVMEPKTGKILAMAAYPSYDPASYGSFDTALFKNPMVADSYEPGSTFKVLTVAAGIDQGLITPDTECTQCSSARKIADYTIKTWNDEYHPNITMRDALAKSDNVAMIFITELLGQDKFVKYIKGFGIGQRTGIELQEDMTPSLRKDWKEIDLATGSFGQGVAVTGLQMVRAVAAIANHGLLPTPTILEKSFSVDGKSVTGTAEKDGAPAKLNQVRVISEAAAQTVTDMMVYAASTGEAKWTNSRTHKVAGKTGTAQIPIAGHYDPKKTMASYIGFAPPDDPKFVMLVKLREPQSSEWAAETAAPLWYQIADQLYLLLNIPADK